MVQFGATLPNCLEGDWYPSGFASPSDLVRIAVHAEEVGFDFVVGNDHLVTRAPLEGEPRPASRLPPSYYELLISLSFVAARTERIRLVTGVVILPLRDPVVLAKEAATLDVLSGGRLVLGVGLGSQREEFLAIRPRDADIRRGELFDEQLRALIELLTRPRASFGGKFVEFHDLESFPKPLQQPLPVWLSARGEQSLRRAARWADGWITTTVTPEQVRQGVEQLRTYAAEAGRSDEALAVAVSLPTAIGRTQEAALDRLRRSSLYQFYLTNPIYTAQFGSDPLIGLRERTLIGTPDQIGERITAYLEAGVTHIGGLKFAAGTVDELLECQAMFAQEVLPRFAHRGRAVDQKLRIPTARSVAG